MHLGIRGNKAFYLLAEESKKGANSICSGRVYEGKGEGKQNF